LSQAEGHVPHAVCGSFSSQWASHKISELNLKRQSNNKIKPNISARNIPSVPTITKMAPLRKCEGTKNKFYMAEILRLNFVISLFIILVGIISEYRLRHLK